MILIGMPLIAVRDGEDWVALVPLPGWGDLMGPGSDEAMTVVLLPDEHNPAVPPEAKQLEAGEFLAQNSHNLLTPILSAMRTHYDAMRPGFLGFLEHPDIQMPPTPALREFVALHDLRQIYIHRPIDTQSARIGFLFGATWEVEHGVGVLTEGLRILDVGAAEVAFL